MDFLQLGQYLRDTRENSERRLEEASQELRIRRSHLEAFERGDFASFGDDSAPVRGFLRNYATWLGLDAERVLAYYDDATLPAKQRGRGRRKTQEVVVAPQRITDTPRSLPPVELADYRAGRGRGLLWGLFLVLVSVASVVVIAFVTVELVRFPQDVDSFAPVVSSPAAGLGVLPPTTTFTPSWTPRPLLATTTPTAIFIGRGVVVEITTTQRTYLRVVVDGGEQFAGVARPDDVFSYEGLNSVTILAGNAAALEVIYNGREQARFGVRGQRVEVNFTPDEVGITTGPGMQPTAIASPTTRPSPTSIASTAILAFTPTDGPSPTPTFTPTLTNTPEPTPTPAFTNTPTLPPTATLPPTQTPLPSQTPTITPTATITQTPSPTAILPARNTPEGLPPTKAGG